MSLKDRVILVTGGARRVGAAISRIIAKSGANLILHYHSSENEANELKDELQSQNLHVELRCCDLSDINQAAAMVASVVEKHGKIDALVGNAAIYYKTPFLKTTEKEWDEILSINLKAYFFLCQQIGIQMKLQKHGKIILISDVSAELAWPNYLPYTISKAGINHLVYGLAKALAPEVQVNAVAPGTVLPAEQSSRKRREFFKNHTLLKKIGAPEDIAKTVRFLLADSEYITGTIIPVDGGFRLEGS